MSRDVKFSRRDSGKHEEIENNIPENLQASFLSQTSNDSISLSRAPLNTIQDPLNNTKHEKESRSKIEGTPSKLRAKNPDPALPLRTPDNKHRSAAFSKNRFGWGEKCDSIANTTPKTGRVAGRANSETNSSTQNTPTKSVSKPPGSCYRGKLDGAGAVRAGGYASLYKGFSSSSGQVSAVVNTVEVPHFDLKEDPSFWMDHNVQILIRVRPLNSMEKSINGYNRCLKQESSQCLAWNGPPETRFLFDHVACETIDQDTLFRVAGLPMVENCLSGYNSCIFAYGQTGSGKTYTMLGEVGDLEVKPSPNRGMMPRIFEFLFARIQAEEESRRDERLKYSCKCSFLEIYNEQITDLLEPSSTNLQLREDIKNGVYVENLTEFEVESVQDILGLITQGSLNRKVGATNMNRESSRSHSVFTCVIESRWEKDSTTNMRFARLNLVDLAGSERQKTSGAEGDRLKEAANINKSLSTLGHVIMVLVDVANGKPRHIPYRDSRLTFLLQDSLGGNSKTMIIANASPSVSCAAETLNTLKFAQRAKLIQNNAVVNEDFNGDVLELRRQIRLLKEELSLLKRQNISRALSFGSATANFSELQVNSPSSEMHETGHQLAGNSLVYESGGCVRMSRKQLKSLETTLAGSLRREHVADASIKKLEAEIEHLNRLVRQREEDTRSTKMMLKFREDKIQRLESLLGNHISADAFLLEENNVLSEEIQLLQAKIDKNPELTRFALENIRLLDQLRRFQEFYEEGEREILLGEVSNLRNQLFQFIDENSNQQKHPDDGIEPQGALRISKENNSLQEELKQTCNELEKCRSNLGSCLEENAKLSRDIHDLQAMVSDIRASTPDDHSIANNNKALLGAQNAEWHETLAGQQVNHVEEIIKLQLDLDVLKIILDEERTLRGDTEAQAVRLKLDIGELQDQLLTLSEQHENVNSELGETKSVVEALESQNIILIQEALELRRIKENYIELLQKQELDIPAMKSKQSNEFKDIPAEDNAIDTKFKKMQSSLEKAKRLNMLLKSDIASKACGDEEMGEVHRQAEAATAEVIVCLQNELEVLQKEVSDFQSKEKVTEKQVQVLETRMDELQDNLRDMTMDNEQLQENLRGKEMELQIISNEMELLTAELEEILLNGNEGLTDACYQADLISGSFPDKRIWISEQIGGLKRTISERELMIEDLENCLEDANKKRCDIESMLKSLRGAALVMSEAHQREYEEKETHVQLLKSQLCTKTEAISRLQEKLKMAESWIYEASHCATASLVIVNRNSEVIESYTFELKEKDLQIEESAGTILSLKQQVQDLEATCEEFRRKLLEEEKNASAMERRLEEIEETGISSMKEKLSELKGGVSGLRSCVNMCQEHDKYTEAENSLRSPAHCSEGQGLGKNVVVSSCIVKIPNNNHTEPISFNSKVSSERGEVIILLRQEMESALVSLKKVQFEMAKLQDEKEELKASEKRSLSNLNDLSAQFCNLENLMNNIEKQYEHKLEVTDHKLKTLEHDFAKMKIEADQKSVENLCIFKKFEEAQGIIKEADITLNELIIANEKMKADLEKQRKREISLVGERSALVDKLQELESIKVIGNEKFENLEKLFESSLMDNCSKDVESLVLALKVEEYSSCLAVVDRELLDYHAIVEGLKEKLFVSQVESELKDLCLADNKLETVSMEQKLTEAQRKIKALSSDLNHSVQKIAEMDEVNKVFGERVFFLESCVAGLHQDLAMKASEIYSLEHSQSVVAEELDIKERDIQAYAKAVGALKNENSSLKHKFIHFGEDQSKAIDVTSLSIAKCIQLTRDGLVISDKTFELICDNANKASEFADTVQSLQIDVQDLLSENVKLQDELLRKDDVLKGLSFDLSLLQESASISRDKKDESREIMVHVEALEKALALKTFELEDVEARLQESKEIICNLEADTEKVRQCQKKLSAENEEIRAEAEYLLAEKNSLEEELIQTKKVSESMEMELFNLRNALGELNDTVEFNQSKLKETMVDRDSLQDEVLYLKEEVGKMNAEARKIEVRYIEAQEIAESRKIYADQREEEVKLLEGSVEKLEYTINVLENKVNVIKDEAERQRLQREELEMELHTIRQQMESSRNSDEEMKRILDEKNMDLEEAKKHIEALERSKAHQKTEISQLSAHISELNLHAEAQARDYMHKFRELEAMAEHVKPEIHVSQAMDSSLSKGSGKPRGSGSPFRCIGLGIAQQMRSEKDEELAAARLRIEELETVVATRQKEVFLLNSKLAKVDSMTHDINRVMLGLKQNCASLLDSQQVLKIAEMLQLHSTDSQERDFEVSQLKQKLNEYNEERQGWIEEMEGKQTDLVTAQIELEEQRQHEQLLKKENKFLKKENVSHKRKVMELEAEVNKLSLLQNPEWRTRDHGRIKEENNMLKLQLDELNLKLRRADVNISRAKEELAWYRASAGKNRPCQMCSVE
ncbi:kinesin-like protein KIN-12D [Eutrema salsugineum]|uniref:kinesin-like protein KIN-12D n=1 Tax=Eutrema salsugineum TaxID=72664 RepID=UPI000CECED1B|nr:kinesin-like protein KIN-12D [Eutrema salsugineum]